MVVVSMTAQPSRSAVQFLDSQFCPVRCRSGLSAQC